MSETGTETGCEICPDGYRPLAHCRDCHRTWKGYSQAHCASCCTHFTSDSAFDKHLASPKAPEDCYDPATLTKADGSPLFKLVQHVSGPVCTVNMPHGRFPLHMTY